LDFGKLREETLGLSSEVFLGFLKRFYLLEKTSVGRDWGEPPSLVEVVPFDLFLPTPSDKVEIWSLDERGQRKERLTVKEHEGQALIQIGSQQKTLWYEVVLRYKKE